jgi:hypothetical protein
MASNTKKLKSALVDATVDVFNAEPDATTVNKVRKQAETNLGLEPGFFSGAEWKQSSKDLIKEHVVRVGAFTLFSGFARDQSQLTNPTGEAARRLATRDEARIGR